MTKNLTNPTENLKEKPVEFTKNLWKTTVNLTLHSIFYRKCQKIVKSGKKPKGKTGKIT